MILSVGNKVSYPGQGLCLVAPAVKRIVDGKLTEFQHLMVLGQGGGELFVPIDKVQTLGVRELLKRSEIPKVLAQLKNAAGTAKNWKQRSRDNLKLFASGTAFDLAEVVESLTELSETKALTPRDHRTLERAKKLLVWEISEVTGDSKGAVEEQLEKALKGRKRAADGSEQALPS
jgi:CarD family transcriptional regulator